MLFIVPRQVSKIGTLMLVNPQSVSGPVRAPVTFVYDLNSLSRRSMYRWKCRRVSRNILCHAVSSSGTQWLIRCECVIVGVRRACGVFEFPRHVARSGPGIRVRYVGVIGDGVND